MQDYLAKEWQQILQQNELKSFDDIWQLELPFFEPPNERRGGTSHVVRMQLKTENGEDKAIFIKRQKNHVLRNFRHPFTGTSTFTRELKNIFSFQANDIPALTPVYFSQRKTDGDLCAILITEELSGYQSLEQLAKRWQQQQLTFEQKKQLLALSAKIIKRMHDSNIRHGCLYDKHLFIAEQQNQFAIRLIDLEKARKSKRKKFLISRDLSQLNRHTQYWTAKERLRFYWYYWRDERDRRLKRTVLKQILQYKSNKD